MTTAKSTELRGKTYPTTLQAQLEVLKRDEDLERFTRSREQLAADRYRPRYHFSPPEHFINDPNGLCQWQGRYHLFYQFYPKAANCWHWGHTVSDDLVRWRDLPIAIYPEQETHCYSGQTLVEPDRVIAIYHGVGSGNSIATASDPLLLNWKKHPNNPVIPAAHGRTELIVPADDDGSPYRVFDPCIWKEDDGYYSLSGVYKDGTRGAVDCRDADHVFRSTDLTQWEHLGPLVEGGFHTEAGEDGAVPNFWPIGNGKHMLLFFSHKRAAQYYIGDYDRTTHRLSPDYHGRMNFGPVSVGSLHAPSATIDDQGRFVAVFNVKEGRLAGDWRDVMTLPRCFSLNADNSMCIEPAAEVTTLRLDRRSIKPMDIPANEQIVLDAIAGKSIEIEAVIDHGEAREVGLCVLRSPDGREETRISLFQTKDQHPKTHALQIDVSAASLRSDILARTPENGPFTLEQGEPLRLRIFIDRSIIEVFANGRQCLTIRAYPQRDDSSGVAIFARGGRGKLLALDAWQMESIWPEL